MTVTIAALLLAKSVVLAALLTAAGMDFARRIIPNEAALAVAAGGLMIRIVSPQDSTVWWSLAVAFLVLVSFGLLARLGVMGGGDVKLMSAVTLTEPVQNVAPLLLHIAIAGGAVALLYLLRGLLRSPVAAHDRPTPRDVGPGWHARIQQSVPYAASILLGVVSFHIAKEIRCSAAAFCWL